MEGGKRREEEKEEGRRNFNKYVNSFIIEKN